MKKADIVNRIVSKFGEGYKVPASNMIDEGLIDAITFRDWAIREDYFAMRKQGDMTVISIHDTLEDRYNLSRSRIIQICRRR